jgi:chromosome partitioning protein
MKIIAFISQKGGVGKSTLARTLAVEATKKKFKVLLADCDPQQATSYEWTKWRQENQLSPLIKSEVFNSISQVGKIKGYDLIIVDGLTQPMQELCK